MNESVMELKRILEASKYTVALCGSGMLREGGVAKVKELDRAYEIERKYGASPEEIFTSAYYNTRPERFFDFYKHEILGNCPSPTESNKALAAMEQAGKLQMIITSNIFGQQSLECEKVINLHGSIYENRCPRCGKDYSIDYMRQSARVPVCESCKVPVRPLVSLFGEMVDSQLMTRTTEEISKADVLLILGTNLDSEVFCNYIRYFTGSKLVMIHQKEHYMDHKADLVIIDQPKNILPQLGY